MLGYICIICLLNAYAWMKYFHNAVLFIWQNPNCIHTCSPQGSGTVLSVNLCATASTNHRRMWRAKSSCLSSRARCTSWDESQSSPSTTRSWSGKPGQSKSAWARSDLSFWLLRVHFSHSTFSPHSLPKSSLTSSSTLNRPVLTKTSEKRRAQFLEGRAQPQPSSRCTPVAL